MIRNVGLFVTDRSPLALGRRYGGNVSILVPRSLLPFADDALGMEGELIAYLAGRDLEFEAVPEMGDREWKSFLESRFTGRPYRRWHGKTPAAAYSVVVVEAECVEARKREMGGLG